MRFRTQRNGENVATKARPKRTMAGLLIAAVLCAAKAEAGYAQAAASLQSACPTPPIGLRQGAQNTNVEIAPFSYDGRTFQMEIASAFSSRHTSGNASLCLRYEAENITTRSVPPGLERIDKFYWPTGEMSVERFESGKQSRQSVLQTVPSAKPPVLGPTDLYAFKRTHFGSTAFKVSVLRQHAPEVQRVSFGGSQGARLNGMARVEEPQIAQLRGISIKDAPHPIGAVWQSPITMVAATTDLDPSRATGSISISLQRGDNKNIGRIYAPFALALSAAKDPKDIPLFIKEFNKRPVEMPENTARFVSSVPATDLFAVKQPIVFWGPDNSRICFLAPTYSPIPIPPDLLTCDPEAVFP
jgi:hypothetical protein